MDIKHVLSRNPLQPGLLATRSSGRGRRTPPDRVDRARRRGRRDRPRRATDSPSTTSCRGTAVHLSPSPWPIGPSPAANGWRSWRTAATRGPSLWLSDGWARRQAQGWEPRSTGPIGRSGPTGGSSPSAGPQPVDPGRAGLPRQLLRGRRLRPMGRARGCRPRPSGRRWPRDEAEGQLPGRPVPPHPRPARPTNAMFGDVWEWTSSAYTPVSRLPRRTGRRRRVQRQVHGEPVRAARADPVSLPRATSVPPTGTSFPPEPAGPSAGSDWRRTPESTDDLHDRRPPHPR